MQLACNMAKPENLKCSDWFFCTFYELKRKFYKDIDFFLMFQNKKTKDVIYKYCRLKIEGILECIFGTHNCEK